VAKRKTISQDKSCKKYIEIKCRRTGSHLVEIKPGSLGAFEIEPFRRWQSGSSTRRHL
jgi:hypothetical protein